MKTKSLTIEGARNLVEHGMALRVAVSGSLREGAWTVVLYKVTEEGESEEGKSKKKKFVEFHELQLANESKTRVFKSLNAAASAILNGIGLDEFHVLGMTVEQAKEKILEHLGAEERRERTRKDEGL